MTPKIIDIARSANVSPATVSRVLRGYPHVSNDKRNRVLQVLKELNYVPNKVAQGLKSKKTGVIGHILPRTFPQPFFASVSLGVDQEAYGNDYRVLTLFSDSDAKREAQHVMDLGSRMVDGIVFTGVVSAKNVERAIELGIPVVMVERAKNVQGVDKVVVDDVQGAYSAVQHMVMHNHRDIGFIGPHPSFDSVEFQRYHGFEKALLDHNLNVQSRFIKYVEDYPHTFGYQAMKELLASGCLPTALLVTSDWLAMGVLQALYEARVRIPDDISVVSYDNSYGGLLSPPLSAVASPMIDLGRSAVRLVLQRGEQSHAASKTVTINTSFVDRASVRDI
ncbi:LacI family DNA-binding transcriptional regulator [Alicyclobacillus fastidiosus]|uniref:LacI family DNA-binding transcriptional regulator n=1 Tax=Alicyclobacillus fastidiosus TaxID=392011 RepID=A0ABV5AEY7_9BACL|nr:LacI family DNA-binding transcriptional regulator [Alicyclobacillus fastidiosus]WEH09794.1 LacI family DNA-binding transcriptional regulator [Alicyclobacillus fastidiosus]